MTGAPTTRPHPDGAAAGDPDDVLMGRVDGVFGVQGQVRLYLYNPETTAFRGPTDVTLVRPDGTRHRTVIDVRPGAGKRILGRLQGVTTPEQAAQWTGSDLLLPRAALPPLDADTWYHRDLLGVPVVTDAGRALGRVTEIVDQGEVDIWVCSGDTGDHYIPVLRDNLVEVVPGVRIVVRDHLAE